MRYLQLKHQNDDELTFDNSKFVLFFFVKVVVICSFVILFLICAFSFKVNSNSSHIPADWNYSGFDECGFHFIPLRTDECNTTFWVWEFCNDYSLSSGKICEGDGECGTSDHLNNCGTEDLYRVI